MRLENIKHLTQELPDTANPIAGTDHSASSATDRKSPPRPFH